MNPEPVRKTITVKASAARAFSVFTEHMDTWWPRTHHIGKAPLTKTLIEGQPGGRCYSQHEDGSESIWGRVLAWEPTHRLVFAWQVSPAWQYEPDLAKSSEVEVQFTPLAGGVTRVDLEHRHFERHGAEVAAQVRNVFDQPTAWSGMLELYCQQAEGGAQ